MEATKLSTNSNRDLEGQTIMRDNNREMVTVYPELIQRKSTSDRILRDKIPLFVVLMGFKRIYRHISLRRFFCSNASNGRIIGPHTMPRYPRLTTAGLLRLCDYTGTVSFASSGALVAGAAGMDVVGCVAVGTITAIGGGTIRDFILGHQRPFWLDEHEYLWMSLLAAALTYSQYRRLKSDESRKIFSTILDWTDHIGVAAFAVIGSMNAIRALGGVRLVTLPHCVIAGVMTATFGGAVRDVVTGRPVRIFHNSQSLYAVAAALTSFTYILSSLYAPGPLAISAALLTGVGARAISAKHHITTATMTFPDEECLEAS